MRFACFLCSLSFGEMASFFGGTYPVFLPSKAVLRIVLTLGMAASGAKRDLEIPERVNLERPAWMHYDRSIRGLDDGRTGDAVAR